MNDSFVFYESYAKGIRTLPPDQQLQLLDAVIDYLLYDKQPKLEGVLYGMFCLIAPTATAACKRHKDKQKAADVRWNKEKESEPQPETPAAAKSDSVRQSSTDKCGDEKKKQNPPAQKAAVPEKDDPTPSEETDTAPRQYHLGKLHNVHLDRDEYDALQAKLKDEFQQWVDRFSIYKIEGKYPSLYNYPALLYFIEHGQVPKELFAYRPYKKNLELMNELQGLNRSEKPGSG